MSDCLPLPSCRLYMLQHLTEKCAAVLCAHVESTSNNNVSGQAKFPCSWGLQLLPLWRRDFFFYLCLRSVDIKCLLNYCVL